MLVNWLLLSSPIDVLDQQIINSSDAGGKNEISNSLGQEEEEEEEEKKESLLLLFTRKLTQNRGDSLRLFLRSEQNFS